MAGKIANTISELTSEAKRAESRDRGEQERRKRLDRISDAHEMIRAGSRLRDEERLDLAVMMHARAVRAAEDVPTRVHALEAYAADQRQLNKPKKAAEAAVHALRLDLSPETNMAAYTILIAALCDLGRNSLASDIAEQALTVSPNDHYLREAARRAFREEASDLELADAQQEAQARVLAAARQATFFADAGMMRELARMVEKAAQLTGTRSLEELLSSLS
jgi:tetratricopeptide (TPR) repeat protein